MEIFSTLLAFVRGIHRSPVISRTKASDAELWSFLWYAPEPTVEQRMETPVIWDAIALIMALSVSSILTHWGQVTHICVSKLTIIGSDNGLSPSRRQAIIWPYAGILLIRPWGTNFSEILIEINVFSFKKIHLKMSSGKWRPFFSASMC